MHGVIKRIWIRRCTHAWRRRIITSSQNKILRKCCIGILIMETAVLAGRYKPCPFQITKTQERGLIEQAAGEPDGSEEKTVYGILIWLKEGEIRFFRTLIK